MIYILYIFIILFKVFIIIETNMFKSIFISILLFFQVFFINFSFSQDALDDVFKDSIQNQIIEDKQSAKLDEKFVESITQTMLKFTIIIWVAVFIYWWIRFLLSMWDDSKAKKTRDTLIISWLWLIIAFWSYVILQVIISIWWSF